MGDFQEYINRWQKEMHQLNKERHAREIKRINRQYWIESFITYILIFIIFSIVNYLAN